MIIYVYSKCSTCQKALNFLTQKKIAFKRKEITETPPSLQELKAMLDYKAGDIKKLFNSSGQLYREWQLSEKLKSLSLEEALTLLSQHGMLVKRPFLIGEGIGLTGFNEKEWEKLR